MKKELTATIHDGTTSYKPHNERTSNYMQKYYQRAKETGNPIQTLEGKKKTRIDTRLTKDNIKVFNRDIKDIYNEYFEPEYKEWVKKQKDKSRCDSSYLAKMRKAKQKSEVREVIFQVNRNKENNDINIKCLKDLINWLDHDEKLKNNIIFESAFIHMDEIDAEIHAHVRYVPISHNNKKGQSTQNSWSGALKEMGYTKGHKQAQFRKYVQDKFDELIIKNYKEENIEVEILHEQSKEYLDQLEYKKQTLENECIEKKQEKANIIQENKELEKKNYQFENELKDLEEEINKIKEIANNTILELEVEIEEKNNFLSDLETIEPQLTDIQKNIIEPIKIKLKQWIESSLDLVSRLRKIVTDDFNDVYKRIKEKRNNWPKNTMYADDLDKYFSGNNYSSQIPVSNKEIKQNIEKGR